MLCLFLQMFRSQKKVSGVGGQALKNEQCQKAISEGA